MANTNSGQRNAAPPGHRGRGRSAKTSNGFVTSTLLLFLVLGGRSLRKAGSATRVVMNVPHIEIATLATGPQIVSDSEADALT